MKLWNKLEEELFVFRQEYRDVFKNVTMILLFNQMRSILTLNAEHTLRHKLLKLNAEHKIT